MGPSYVYGAADTSCKSVWHVYFNAQAAMCIDLLHQSVACSFMFLACTVRSLTVWLCARLFPSLHRTLLRPGRTGTDGSNLRCFVNRICAYMIHRFLLLFLSPLASSMHDGRTAPQGRFPVFQNTVRYARDFCISVVFYLLACGSRSGSHLFLEWPNQSYIACYVGLAPRIPLLAYHASHSSIRPPMTR